MKVVALAGGVGGAKLVDGLARILPPEDLTVIVNTGDDFEHLGLHISPDIDTICYTLAGLANPDTGWGRAEESWQALETLKILGGPAWFRLGDRDLGLHLERTRRLRNGETLSQVTEHICRALHVDITVLPMSDDFVPTWVYTKDGTLSFQEYFVHRLCEPEVTGFYFENVETARPAPGVMRSLGNADLVVICPSNPWVSVRPILEIPGILSNIEQKYIVAVSPIIGGRAVKGPAAKMYSELGIKPSALAVAEHYGNLVDGFVIDNADREQIEDIQSMNIQVHVTQSIMNTTDDRIRLAKEVLDFGQTIIG